MANASSGGEQVFYQDTVVTITTARAIIAGTTYAMANITSVRQHEEPAKIGCLVGGAMLGVIFGILLAFGGSWFGWVLLLVGAGCSALAYFGRHSKHWVRIGTAGAETNAVFSHNRDWTARVVAALNEAIISRG